MNEIIKKLDEADAIIRERLKLQAIPIGERAALEEARTAIQQAITRLLHYC
jgi:hypothetical protein